MISLSVIKIKMGDDKYLMTRNELNQIRKLLTIKPSDPKAAPARLQDIITGKHTLENGKKYTLSLDTVKITDTFYVWNTRKKLTAAESEHIIKLINCAISAPNTLLAFPDYIVISDTPPAAPKPKVKRKKKDADK